MNGVKLQFWESLHDSRFKGKKKLNSMCTIILLFHQVLKSSTMPTLDKDLAPSSWMTCSALEERQGLLTVQGAPAQELGTLTFAGDIWMMLD